MLTFSIDHSIGEVMAAAGLFEEIPKNSLEREWVSELFFKSLSGYQSHIEDDFDLGAFTAKCEQNKVFCDNRKAVPLLTTDEYFKGHSGILETSLTYEQKEFDLLIEHLNLQNTVKEFYELQEMILIEEGKSLYQLLKLSLQYAEPRRVECIIALMNKYSIQELLIDILSNSHALQILELV